jgi:2-polyprenyl-6-methoxyphenol hydroxylase-like FAD-dependent oxidoreductase
MRLHRPELCKPNAFASRNVDDVAPFLSDAELITSPLFLLREKDDMDILINGAGIAGLTLAYWLARYGFRPTLIELAPNLRTGGYIIDFWGAGYEVADMMGLVPELKSEGYSVQEVKLVDSRGRRVGGFNADVFARATAGRFVSLPRGVLAESLHRKIAGKVATVFGDEIIGLRPQPRGTRVWFQHGSPRNFDLVIGAGGLHSNVRALCFGQDANYTQYLGYKVAAFEADYPIREELTYVGYATPGQQVARFSLRNGSTLFLLVMADGSQLVPPDADAQRSYVHGRFDRAGWECPAIMAAMDSSPHIYFDNVSQICMRQWSRDRIALVGDAAACPSLLAGEGASLAMAEAYVLAGELYAAQGKYRTAFERYEAALRPLIERKQKAARRFATAFAPRTTLGIKLRNLVTRAMGVPLVADLALGQSVRDDFELPAYA